MSLLHNEVMTGSTTLGFGVSLLPDEIVRLSYLGYNVSLLPDEVMKYLLP